MFNFDDYQPLTKDFILNHVSEDYIFERYLGIKPELGKFYCNPLRSDDNPSCNFNYDKFDRLKFHDPGGGFNWDCFNVVEYLERVSFKEALKVVAIDFGLLQGTKSVPAIKREIRKKEKIGVRIKRRDFNKQDRIYWFLKYGITRADLARYNTFPVSIVWLERETILSKVYYYQDHDLCYAYHFGGYDYKLYYPMRAKGRRFHQTRGDIVQGLEQLPAKGHILIITKSMKDVITISKFSHICDVHAIAPMSETQLLSPELMEELKSRFDYIFTLFDFDRAGIKLMRKYEQEYELPHLMFGMQYKVFGVKDFSDHREHYGYERTAELVKSVYDQVINGMAA